MTQTIEQLTARVRELEEEKRLLEDDCGYQMQWKREFREQLEYSQKQLAASQAYAEQLREKIEALWGIIDDIDSYGDMAKADDKLFRSLVEKRQKDRWETGITTDGYVLNMPIPHDTSALDAYVAENVKEIIESHAPEGRNVTNAQHVEMRHKFLEQITTLTRQRDLAVEALEAIAGRRIFIDNLASNVDIAVMTLSAIKESEGE